MSTISIMFKLKLLVVWLTCIQMAYGSTGSECDNREYKTVNTTEGRPEVELQILNDNIFVDGKAFFTCKVRANPAAKILWLYEGDFIRNKNQQAMYRYSDCNTTLKITLAEHRDTGRYTCMARNFYGGTTSKSILLAVEVKAKFQGLFKNASIETVPSRLCNLTHKNVTITCKHNGSRGVCTWKKNKQRMSTEKITYCDDKMCCLSINDFSEDDTGLYTCFMYLDKYIRKADVTIPPAKDRNRTEYILEHDDEIKKQVNECTNSTGEASTTENHIGVWYYGIIALFMKVFCF